MCKKLDKLIKEETENALKIVREENERQMQETARRMQECGISQELIARCVNEPVEQVKVWLSE